MEKIQNEKTYIEYREDKKEIFGRDLTDMNNEPAFYTKSKRGIKKAWDEIKKQFCDETTMYAVTTICSGMNIRTHYWCMMD